jgi:hypothetical protein
MSGQDRYVASDKAPGFLISSPDPPHALIAKAQEDQQLENASSPLAV